MNMTDAWDDARLAAAYHAMAAARPTPRGLEARILVAIRAPSIGPRPLPFGLARLLPTAASFGAVALALVVVVALGGLPRGGAAVRTAASPATSSDRSSAPSTPGATATTSAIPTMMGIPVVTVPELIARRTGGPPPSPEEVAVRGWMVRSNVVYRCKPDPDPHVLDPRCLSPIFLMERPERSRGITTDGPSVVPVLGLDSHIEVDIPRQEPAEVIAIGHLADHRWPTCRAAKQDACRRQFVIDRLVAAEASVDALPSPWRIPRSSTSEPAAAPEDVISRLEALVGAITVVSRGFVEGDVLREIEPGVADPVGPDGDAAFKFRALWVVRGLVGSGPDRSVARTFLIPDVPADEPSTSAWEATERGVTPVPEPGTELPWPPEGATIVELPTDVGSGRLPVRVAVIDRTGYLVEARAATTREMAVRDITTGAVFADDLPDGRVLVQWGGSMCDDRLTLTIEALDAGTPDTLTVDGRRGSSCRLALAYYAVVLRFEPAIGAADLGGRYLIGP